MNGNGKPETVVHFVANIGGGVWSTVKSLATLQRPCRRVMLVGIHMGRLRPTVVAETAEYFDGVHLVRRPAVAGGYYLAPVSVAAAIRSLGVDLHAANVVYHFHTGPYTSWVYRLPRRLLAGNWLVSFHGSRGSFGDLHSRVKRWMHVTGVKDLLARRLTLVAVSQRSAAECAAMYGCQAAAFRVAYNGADIPSTDHAELRTQPHHPFRVGFLGTLAAFKGWRKVITAVEQLRGEGLPVVCSIVGAGRDLPALQRLAVERAEWLDAPGHVENPGEHLFPALDVLVLPSECEGHPQVILEALGSGVPCICSDVGGCAETIRHGREGYILRENSAEEIAAYINNIVSSEPLWAQLSHNSLARHREAFTAQHMVNRWEQLYRDGSHP